MADSAAQGVEPYGFDRVFERLIAQHCAAAPTFWARVGESIDPESFSDPACRLVMRAVALVAKDLGRGPKGTTFVRQRIRHLHNDGKIDITALRAARSVLKDADENVGTGDIDEDALLAELTPVLVRRMQKNALKTGLDVFAKKGSLDVVTAMLAKAGRVGKVDTMIGTQFGSAVFESIVSANDVERLSTGIPELDAALEGGMKRGCFGAIMGASNAGKSLMLSHMASEAIANHIPLAYATLEISEADTYARMIANLVELETNNIGRFANVFEEAVRRVKILEEEHLLDFAIAKYFTPEVTTIDDIMAWLDAAEERCGKKIDVLFVDSANHLTAKDKKTKHEQQDAVSARLRDFAHKTGRWVWSSVQADAAGMDTQKVKRLDMHNTAYSKGIPRNCDLMITLNPREEGMLYYVAKNRLGRRGEEIGPLPTEFEFGRMVGVARRGWPRIW